MALKVISGVIVNKGKKGKRRDVERAVTSGTAVIGFSPHRLIEGSPGIELSDMQVIGTEESFVRDPAVIVAMREHHLKINRDMFDFLDVYEFQINDEVGLDRLTVNWNCKMTYEGTDQGEGMDQGKILEISYMVIGET